MRIYYGWFIVAIGMLVLTLSLGTTTSAFGLFVLPVSEAFGLSRANINTGIILLNLGMAVASPLLGRALDSYPARRVMIVSALLYGVSFVALGLSHHVWLSAAVIAGPLAMAVVGLGTLTSLALVARWFTANRGRALAITAIGMSLSWAVVPAIGLLLEAVAWRQTLIIVGFVLAAVFLLLVPLIREGPQSASVEPVPPVVTAGAPEPPGQTGPLRIGEIARMPQFWTIALSLALTYGALQAILVALVPLAREGGFTMAQSTSLLSIMGGSAIVGKLVLAWIGDRVNRTMLLAVLFILVALTSLAMLYAQSYEALIACSLFLGLVAGTVTPAFLALVADEFGTASFGTANGCVIFITTVASAACIRFGGEVYDRTGGYELMFVAFIPAGVLAAALMISTRTVSRGWNGKPSVQGQAA